MKRLRKKSALSSSARLGDLRFDGVEVNRTILTRMLGDRIVRRLDAVRHELRYGAPAALQKLRNSAHLARKRRALASWFSEVRRDPPDVLIGANIELRHGIRNHLVGIRDHSSLRVQLSPPDKLLPLISYHDLHTTLREELFAFAPPAGVRVVHSHVYAYYIEWCRRYRDAGPLWVHTYHLPYFPLSAGGALLGWQQDINRALIKDARHAHVRISVSKWQQQYYEQEHGISTIYLPNGVDVELCDRADATRFTNTYNLQDFILFVGRDDPVKNPREFFQLVLRMPDQIFVMIGAGLDRESIRKNWGVEIPPNLLLLGPASRDVVQDALAACSALVVTSIREGLPTLVLEAMAHSRPVVVSNEPGCSEVVDHGKYGLIYRLGEIDDLLEKTRAAIGRGCTSRHGRERVLSEYDWRAVAPRLDAIYRGSGS